MTFFTAIVCHRNGIVIENFRNPENFHKFIYQNPTIRWARLFEAKTGEQVASHGVKNG